jgi:hypothetical protein
MQATKTAKKRGRPRGELRNWLSKEMPKLKPPAKRSGGDKDVSTLLPDIDQEITVSIPKNWTLIPLVLTHGKSAATIGQTTRNERIARNIKHRIIVHTVPQTLEVGRGKTKKVLEFPAYAIEVK